MTFRIHSTLANDAIEAGNDNTSLSAMLILLVAVGRRQTFSMISPGYQKDIRNGGGGRRHLL